MSPRQSELVGAEPPPSSSARFAARSRASSSSSDASVRPSFRARCRNRSYGSNTGSGPPARMMRARGIQSVSSPSIRWPTTSKGLNVSGPSVPRAHASSTPRRSASSTAGVRRSTWTERSRSKSTLAGAVPGRSTASARTRRIAVPEVGLDRGRRQVQGARAPLVAHVTDGRLALLPLASAFSAFSALSALSALTAFRPCPPGPLVRRRPLRRARADGVAVRRDGRRRRSRAGSGCARWQGSPAACGTGPTSAASARVLGNRGGEQRRGDHDLHPGLRPPSNAPPPRQLRPPRRGRKLNP